MKEQQRFTVAAAGFKDLPGVMELYRILDQEMAALQPDRKPPQRSTEDWALLTLVLSASDAVLLVVRDEQEAVQGFALLQLRQEGDDAVCRLLDFCVAPQSRNCGLGTKLLDAAKVWAKDQGAQRLQLRVLAQNHQALAFYERAGLKEHSRILEMPL